MSIILQSSGGGSVTIAEPATASNFTQTLPAATGTVVITGTTPTFNGITFPATQVPSADANTLDDYEEGTFTPVFSNITVGNGTAYGRYTKIGNIVNFSLGIVLGSTSSITGDVFNISGLPFTTANISSQAYYGVVGQIWDNGAGWRGIFAQIENNSTIIGYPLTTNAYQTINATTPITFTTNDSINLNGSYRVS